MPLEPVHEQIAAAIKTVLEGIVEDSGVTYWYTPDVVVRCIDWPGSNDVSRSHVLFLKADSFEVSEMASSRRVEGRVPFSVLIMKKYERSSTDPFDEDKSADAIGPTVINRLWNDVVTALLADVTLGGAAWNVAAGPITVDPSFQIGGGWLSAVVSFTVIYDYTA